MSKGKDKRRQCDGCPAIKRVICVKIHGEQVNLCEKCRLTYSRIVREREAEKARRAQAALA
jgi:hypothetical protein